MKEAGSIETKQRNFVNTKDTKTIFILLAPSGYFVPPALAY
jgi:hypothetical protein